MKYKARMTESNRIQRVDFWFGSQIGSISIRFILSVWVR